MRVNYLPYYFSRLFITGLFCFSTMGLTLQAGIWSLAIFTLMVFYLHSGWFTVNPEKPFFPLRRDAFALDVQRKALILAVVTSLMFNLFLKLFPWFLQHFPWLDINILGLGIVVYFLAQFFQFSVSRFTSD